MISGVTPPAPRVSGSFTLRTVPRSTPESISWPSAHRIGLTDGPANSNQPVLPWRPEPVGPAKEPEPAKAYAGIRVSSFGQGWAEPLPPGLPEPELWSVRLAAALLEALQRLRPLSQLTRWLDASTLSELTVEVRRSPWQDRRRLIAVHVHRINDRAVEVSAVLRNRTGRTGALAFRLEVVGRRWLCTALETDPQNRSC